MTWAHGIEELADAIEALAESIPVDTVCDPDERELLAVALQGLDGAFQRLENLADPTHGTRPDQPPRR